MGKRAAGCLNTSTVFHKSCECLTVSTLWCFLTVDVREHTGQHSRDSCFKVVFIIYGRTLEMHHLLQC